MKLPFSAKKSLGQNFLNNQHIPDVMTHAAHITENDTVLEIGPGTGALTQALLATNATIIAVETDTRAYDTLQETFKNEIANGKLQVINKDIRTFITEDLEILLPKDYIIVANIPYYLSGFLFRTFLEHTNQPKTLVFLIQKEVAERIARDSKESLLSLSVKAYGTPQYIQTVKRGNFSPPPKVDSAIIAVTNISKKNFENISEKDFFTLLRLGLAGKRKQLLGALAKKHNRDKLTKIFLKLNISETIRGEDLSIHTWLTLAEHIYTT